MPKKKPKQKSLTKKQWEGITVPPEYGSIEIEQVKTKEGEEPKFIAKAFYSERKSDAMTLNHEIKIDKKEYSSKPEAKKAAEQALAKHYYENGLEEYKKPQVENAKEETKTEITPEQIPHYCLFLFLAFCFHFFYFLLH